MVRNFSKLGNVFSNVNVSSGKYSVGIVNNINGKRVSISSNLANELGIDNEVSFMADLETKELLIAADFPFEGALSTVAKGETKKIIYNASLVAGITEAFNLNFTGKTSMSFNNITVIKDDETGIKYAAVKIQSRGATNDNSHSEVA